MNAIYTRPSDSRNIPPKGSDAANGADVLTVAEVATALRSSKAHICNIIAGRVRGVAPLAVLRLGRRILVRRATLEEWKSRCETAS